MKHNVFLQILKYLMKKVLTFGELLIRLQSSMPSFISGNEENTISAFAGGSEANVSMALSQLNIPTAYFTAIPQNAITKEVVVVLNNNTIDTSKILWQGDRVGTYILLSANGLTSGDVIYDRKYSSFSQLKANAINWDVLFKGCTWFHWTALTPSLSENMAFLMKTALEEAAGRGLFISVDLNYRSKLWQYGKDPIEVMPDLVKYCDCIMGNIWAANKMLGTTIDTGLDRSTPKEDYIAYANNVAAQLFTLFPKCRHIANTFRFMDNPKHNLLYGTYHNTVGNYVSGSLETHELIDRIGSGDAFMAGVIAGIYNQDIPQQIIDLATQTGFDKLFVKGDFLVKI